MMQTLMRMISERRSLRSLGASSPDVEALQSMLAQLRHHPDSLSDTMLRSVVTRASEPNWDAPPHTIHLVEEIRRAAEWVLEDRARSRPVASEQGSERIALTVR